MKTIMIAVVCVSILAVSINGEDAVSIGESKELVIENNILVPVPVADWDWYAGQKLENKGIQISTFICKSADEQSAFNLVVFHDKLKEDKEKFAKGLLQGAANSAKKSGYQLTESKTKAAKIPWPGSIEYTAVLSQPDGKIHLKGFIAFGRGIYALQYSGKKEAPAYLDKVAKGMRNLATKPRQIIDSEPKRD